jgi:hypothetical protein
MTKKRLTQLGAYSLGDLDEINTDLGPQPAIRIRTLGHGWNLWLDIVAFCEATGTLVESFTEDLDFSQLDS